MFDRLLRVALREVKAYAADRGDLFFSLLLPIAVLALMLGAFSGSGQFNATASVVDRDGGPVAQALLAQLRAVPGLEVKLLAPADAQRQLDRSEILLYTEIPAGFSQALASGQPVEVVRHQRGNGAEADQIVAALVQAAAQRAGTEIRVRTQVAAALDTAGVSVPAAQLQAAVAQQVAAADASPPVAVVTEGTGRQTDPAETFFPNVTVMFILFSITLNAQSLVQERRQGTLERLMATRLSENEFLAGKFIGNVFRGLIQLGLLFGLGAIVFHFFTLSSFLWSLVLGVTVVAACSAIGLVVAVLSRTPNQAVWFAVFLTMAMTLVGGTFFSAAGVSGLGGVEKATVTYWANQGFHRLIAEGAGLAGIAGTLAVMGGIVVVGLGLSRVLFVRQTGRA